MKRVLKWLLRILKTSQGWVGIWFRRSWMEQVSSGNQQLSRRERLLRIRSAVSRSKGFQFQRWVMKRGTNQRSRWEQLSCQEQRRADARGQGGLRERRSPIRFQNTLSWYYLLPSNSLTYCSLSTLNSLTLAFLYSLLVSSISFALTLHTFSSCAISWFLILNNFYHIIPPTLSDSPKQPFSQNNSYPKMSEQDGDLVPQRESLSAKPLPEFIKNHADIFRIGIFEGVGTLMLAYGICIGQYLPPVNQKQPNIYYDFFISAVLFLAICWSGSMTGGHINPAVTLGQMIRLPKISLRTGLVYMLTQFLGAFVGALLAWGFYDVVAGPYNESTPFFDLFLDFVGEAVGTFLFVFFILMMTTPETTFVQDKFWVYIIIPLLLYACRTFSFRCESLNPAVAFAVMFFKSIELKNGMLFVYAIFIILGPFVGGYLAGLFFQKVYKKIHYQWKNVDEN